MNAIKPAARPGNPCFSSGPCAKRPGWTLEALGDAALGRSHRAKVGKAKLQAAIDLTRELLEVPADYRIGIVPGSDTGAFEMAMWTMLGARPVDVLAWESFGEGWVTDAVKQLKLDNTRVLKAPYGEIVDFAEVDFDHDVVFTWNGTTSGVRVPNGDAIPATRAGLTLCDATSGAFAQHLPWPKLDVVTFSWQKALGGEAAHGMLVLSPRAVERLQTYVPPRPLPKVFRLTSGGKLSEGIFAGETINTPSMLCVEDYLDALRWGQSVGGLEGLVGRADRNAEGVERLGGPHPLGGQPCRTSRHPLEHLRMPQGGRPRGDGAAAPKPRPSSPRLSRPCSRRRASPSTSAPTATRPRACASGAAPPSRRPTWKRSRIGSTGPMRSPPASAAPRPELQFFPRPSTRMLRIRLRMMDLLPI